MPPLCAPNWSAVEIYAILLRIDSISMQIALLEFAIAMLINALEYDPDLGRECDSAIHGAPRHPPSVPLPLRHGSLVP